MSKILIANSHDPVVQQFVSVLEPEGHTFSVCANGDSVRNELARGTPDLVMADVDLPGLDVFELAQLLYDQERDRSIPLIIVHSGLSEGVETPLGEATGFTWMGLSASPDTLRSVVQAKLTVGTTPASTWQVLVVDDDATIRDALARRLKMEGYTVLTAQDGEEGLGLMSRKPDMVLMDVDMPKLDGFAVLENMRAHEDLREIPVIIMTAQARSAEEVERGLRLGANDYLRKPFDMLELVARVRTQLRLQEAHRLSLEKHRDLAVIELAGAAAHEINNPLAVLSARLELMLAAGAGEVPERKHLEQMQELIVRIAEVVRKLGHIRRYQVQTYCGDVNIVDLDGASGPDL